MDYSEFLSNDQQRREIQRKHCACMWCVCACARHFSVLDTECMSDTFLIYIDIYTYIYLYISYAHTYLQ